MTYLVRALMRLKMLWVKHHLLAGFTKDASQPARVQAALLKNILLYNAGTDIGRRYDFATIDSYATFKQRVPIHQYEDLHPYLESQIYHKKQSLTTERPVMYAQTSGTTGKAKYIPILQETIDAYKKAQRIFSYVQQRDVPGIFSGKILAIVSPAVEGRFEDGTSYGSMSGMVYENMPDIVFSKYVLPPEVFTIDDYKAKYLLIAAFALAEEHITVLASANPSTFLRLREVIEQHKDALIACIEQGDLSVLDLPLHQAYTLSPNPERAKALKQLGGLKFCEIWPELKAVVTWTSGNGALLLPRLRKELSADTIIIEMGYLASEFRGTITIDCHKNLGIPTLQDVFFEFIETTKWENGLQDTLILEQIEQGKYYYIIVTASHGLYRYFINDIIEVTGRYQNTPTIAFVQKGKGVTNLTGEKLYEIQVIQAVQEACAASGIEPCFFIMLADQENFSYTLYLESEQFVVPELFATLLHQELGKANMEYLTKTESGRLLPVQVRLIKAGTQEAFKARAIQAGQREGQFKMVKLQYRKDVAFPFEEYLL